MSKKDKLYIANAQGFWGDSPLAPARLIEEGKVDYLTFDYLAEITMSIMQKQKMKNPDLGYATDFVKLMGQILPKCKEKGIKIIANAGGVNPRGCLDAVRAAIKDSGVEGIKIGIVEGDDILDDLPELMKSGEEFSNLEDGEPILKVLDKLTSANVYIGAEPIAEALRQGADVVITGRASDPSVVLAPLIYEFGWTMEDYDKMAAGTIMGHIIECGPQCTGGNFTDWKRVPDLANIGYPIIEANPDGSFVVTKHAGTGGLIDVDTVTAQLLYELGEPTRYLSPDCTADFTSIKIAQDGENRVAISGIKGGAPTPTYKVSMSYSKGHKILTTLAITGPDAIEKAHVVADMVFQRMALHGVDIPEEDRFLELFGTNVLYKGLVPSNEEPHEILMRLGAFGDNPKALNVMGLELAPILTAGPPGITGFAGGRARATEIVGYWPALIDKTKVKTSVTVETA